MKKINKQLTVLCIILSITVSFFQQSYIFAEDNSIETQIKITYQDESNSRETSYKDALLAVVKREGKRITINCNNVCPHVVKNIKVQMVLAHWSNDKKEIKKYDIRPINLGDLSPGSGTKANYTIPALIAYPIQLEVFITGNVKAQVASGYSVVVF